VPGTPVGPYTVLDLIGSGGMGDVYRARDPRLSRDVALKVVLAGTAADPDTLLRFEQEARATGMLNHPNIMAIYDVGRWHGQPYVVTELLEGRTLRQLLAAGRLSPRSAIGYAIDIARGLAAAHRKEIVHRDLKPENVMIVESPAGDELKIMDFGLAKVLDSGTGATESVTVAGRVMGTLGYMAPEVVNGNVVDERADLFAIGVMVVETLTGVRPFRGSTQQEILLALLGSEYHLAGESAEIRALDAIVQRCLAKDPRDRYGSSAELAKDLVPALARCEDIGGPYDLTLPDAKTS
jgi:serine/threonine protein kinase